MMVTIILNPHRTFINIIRKFIVYDGPRKNATFDDDLGVSVNTLIEIKEGDRCWMLNWKYRNNRNSIQSLKHTTVQEIATIVDNARDCDDFWSYHYDYQHVEYFQEFEILCKICQYDCRRKAVIKIQCVVRSYLSKKQTHILRLKPDNLFHPEFSQLRQNMLQIDSSMFQMLRN